MKAYAKISVTTALVFSIIACSVFTPNATTQPSPQNEEQPNQISAGFTDNEEMPFIIIHQSGEQLAVTKDVNSNEKTGIIWVSPENNSVTIYADKDGNPKGAVVGDDILLYSNFKENRIDITILHPDGTSEVFNELEIDTTLINKVTSKSSSSYNLVSLSYQNLLLQNQKDDFWDFMDYAWITVGVASCLTAFMVGTGAGAAAGAPAGGVGAVPGATAGAIATFAVLASLCGSVIVDVAIKTAEIRNIDVIPLESAKFIKDLNDCKTRKLLDWQACGQTITTILQTLSDTDEDKINKNSEAQVILETQSSYSCDGENPDPYYCTPVVYVSMFYMVDGTRMGGTIGQVSCADALKFKPIETLPGDGSQITSSAWSWAYENEVTLFINGWDSQFNEIHPIAEPSNILFTYPATTVIETHPECKPPN